MTTENINLPEHSLRDMRNFWIAVDRVRCTPGLEVELLTHADDLTSGFKRTYSHLSPLEDENKLKSELDTLILGLVPEGETRETLEKGFEEDPDHTERQSHADIVTSEWQTLQPNVVIGVRAVRDQRGESVRSWYLRNTEKKKWLFFFKK